MFAIDGDGCFQMTMQELITASVEGIPAKIAVMNNGSLGMVKQWQKLFYHERLSAVELGSRPHTVLADHRIDMHDARCIRPAGTLAGHVG